MKPISKAIEVGQFVGKLAQGYFTFSAIMSIATNGRASTLAPKVEPGQIVPIGRVPHVSGGAHEFDFQYYLDWAKSDEVIRFELDRVWISGSLLRIGDLLAKYDYFDRAPELELVRHLRNGVAHGNRFRIDYPERLRTYPAHNKLARFKNNNLIIEIHEGLNGREVLFDFITAADVVTLLQSVSSYLLNYGETNR